MRVTCVTGLRAYTSAFQAAEAEPITSLELRTRYSVFRFSRISPSLLRVPASSKMPSTAVWYLKLVNYGSGFISNWLTLTAGAARSSSGCASAKSTRLSEQFASSPVQLRTEKAAK
jgi:hypothetical protein